MNSGIGFDVNPALLDVELNLNDTTIPCHIESVTENTIVCKMDNLAGESVGFITATVTCEGVPSDPVIIAERFRPGLLFLS